MHERCDECQTEYDFTPKNARLHLFVENPECNYIQATCPQCKAVETVFTTSDSFLHVMEDCKLQLTLAPRADDQLKERAKKTWATVKGEIPAPRTDDLPEPPREWLRSLYDDLRTMEG